MTTEEIQPESLLQEFRDRSEALDARLDTLLETIQQIRGELRHDAENSLTRLAQVAVDMANGRVYQQIDMQAKGEIGTLVQSLNQTLQNLQQLDASVKSQSTQVPELAAQLDAITADTEQATQDVMNRLDALMATADDTGRKLAEAGKLLDAQKADRERLLSELEGFLTRAQEGAQPAELAQEVLDFLFAYQMAPQPDPVDLAPVATQLRSISDEAFEILNVLQFQDITRQKVEKVVQLLKQFREGLDRLLAIFHIGGEGLEEASKVFEHRHVATQDHIFETKVTADEKTKESVDDIIAQFKANR